VPSVRGLGIFLAYDNGKSLTLFIFFQEQSMKQHLLPAIILMFGAALASAQPGPQNQAPGIPGQFPPGPNNSPPQFQQALTAIQGTLGLVNGRVAVQTGEITYYIRGLDPLFGFVDGLKEGAAVTLEGYAVDIPPAPEYKYFLVEKLGINGREYGGLLSGRRGFSEGPGGFPPPGAMMRDRRDYRQPPAHQRYYYYDRRQDKD
jgi:hypothetical protein